MADSPQNIQGAHHLLWTRQLGNPSRQFIRLRGRIIVLPLTEQLILDDSISHLSTAIKKHLSGESSCSTPKRSPHYDAPRLTPTLGPLYLFITSPRAARLFSEAISVSWLRGLPSTSMTTSPQIKIIAFGEHTRQILTEKRWRLSSPDGDSPRYLKSDSGNYSTGYELATALVSSLHQGSLSTPNSPSWQTQKALKIPVWFIGAQHPAWDYKALFTAQTFIDFRHFAIYQTRTINISDLSQKPLTQLRSLNPENLSTVFFAPSAVHAYADLNLPWGQRQLAMGLSTARALQGYGQKPNISPQPRGDVFEAMALRLPHESRGGR